MNRQKIITSMILSCVLAGAPLSMASAQVSRPFAGTSRYDTALKIVSNGWTSSINVVIAAANNGNLADALTAASLAKKMNAPIFLTDGNLLDASTIAKIKSLGVKNIFITSGTGVIKTSVETQLKSIGIKNINRLGGKDRYETSINIAKAVGTNGTVMVARGDQYADALSAAAIAAAEGIPIIFSSRDSLPDNVKSYIASSGVKSAYVLGLQGALSDNVAKNLPNPKRLGGANRYETNLAIVKEFQDGLDFSRVYVASGEEKNLVDTLAGSPLAAKFSAPVILTSSTLPESTAAYLSTALNSDSAISIFGGEGAVPKAVSDKLSAIQAGVPSGKGSCTASVKIVLANVLKQITVSSTDVAGCTKYRLEGSSAMVSIGQPITLVAPDSSINVFLYSDSGNLLARGSINTSTESSSVKVSLQLAK